MSAFTNSPGYVYDIKNDVARIAVNAMLAREIGKSIERLKGEIEENGLDVVRNYFPHIFDTEDRKEAEK